jgi:transcriptional regulator with XRE-family HTH domain
MERLRQYLDSEQISQTEFGRRIGVSQPTVCEWLSGDSAPSIANLKKISATTGLSIDDLLDHPRRQVAS